MVLFLCLALSDSMSLSDILQRYEIVNGVVEVEGVSEAAMDLQEDSAKEGELFLFPFFFFLILKYRYVLKL